MFQVYLEEDVHSISETLQRTHRQNVIFHTVRQAKCCQHDSLTTNRCFVTVIIVMLRYSMEWPEPPASPQRLIHSFVWYSPPLMRLSQTTIRRRGIAVGKSYDRAEQRPPTATDTQMQRAKHPMELQHLNDNSHSLQRPVLDRSLQVVLSPLTRSPEMRDSTLSGWRYATRS